MSVDGMDERKEKDGIVASARALELPVLLT